MSDMKTGMGDSSEHPLNRQFERGPGATNVPLKKSDVNPTQPNVNEGRAHAAGAPKSPLTAGEKTGGKTPDGVVGYVGAQPSKEKGSTFQAPRKEGSMNPVECGYTPLGKV